MIFLSEKRGRFRLLPCHYFADYGHCGSVWKWAEVFVGFLQHFSYVYVLWAVLLAFAAVHASGWEVWVVLESDVAGVFEAYGGLGPFDVHEVVVVEGGWDVDAAWAWHAVSAAGASDFLFLADDAAYAVY